MIRDIDNSNTGSSPGPWHARILAWPLSVVVDFEKLVTSAPRVGLGRVRDLVFFFCLHHLPQNLVGYIARSLSVSSVHIAIGGRSLPPLIFSSCISCARHNEPNSALGNERFPDRSDFRDLEKIKG